MAPKTALEAFSLDDFEARAGSATSVIRTISGLYLSGNKDPSVPRSLLVDLARAAGVAPTAAQTAITRLRDRGLFSADNAESAVRISAPALAMFARGTRRIFTPRQMQEDDPWLLVTYSLPEALRAARHQLRKHFSNLGGGIVNAGLWIFPHYLNPEVTQVLEALDARQYSTLFISGTPLWNNGPQDSASSWWNLDKLAQRHQLFLENTACLVSASLGSPEDSYRRYVQLVDAWRAIPYLDPGLPQSMLPSTWPGTDSRERFTAMSASLAPSAQQYVAASFNLQNA